MTDDGTVTWRELLAETTTALAGVDGRADLEARWMIEAASGHEGAELAAGLGELATQRGVAHLDAMVARRRAGEPVQYVLGRWPFRTLDLLCDKRVLIPRPETEQVVEHALAELDEVLLARHGDHDGVVVDLGTGSGAIALSFAVERPGTRVWAVEASPTAAAVARANLAGLGMAGGRVRVVESSWFAGLPDELRGTVDLVITNPPYIAESESLAPSVADWEPVQALIPGPTGLEAYEALLAEVTPWLAPGAAFVAEIGFTQAAVVSALVAQAGLVDIRVHQDHAGHDRTVVARNPS